MPQAGVFQNQGHLLTWGFASGSGEGLARLAGLPSRRVQHLLLFNFDRLPERAYPEAMWVLLCAFCARGR